MHYTRKSITIFIQCGLNECVRMNGIFGYWFVNWISNGMTCTCMMRLNFKLHSFISIYWPTFRQHRARHNQLTTTATFTNDYREWTHYIAHNFHAHVQVWGVCRTHKNRCIDANAHSALHIPLLGAHQFKLNAHQIRFIP